MNQEKYFDLAVSGDVCIKNDNYMFHILCKPVEPSEEQKILAPNDKLRNALTKDELLKGIHEDIDKRFAKK